MIDDDENCGICSVCCPDGSDDEEEGRCPDCGAAEDEECDDHCPSWDEEDRPASVEPSLVELFACSRERQAGNIKMDPIKFLRELREDD